MTGAKKLIDEILIKTGRINREIGCFRTQFQRLGANFADRWPRWREGALKWPLKRGSRLIEVAATAGLTVCSGKI